MTTTETPSAPIVAVSSPRSQTSSPKVRKKFAKRLAKHSYEVGENRV